MVQLLKKLKYIIAFEIKVVYRLKDDKLKWKYVVLDGIFIWTY